MNVTGLIKESKRVAKAFKQQGNNEWEAIDCIEGVLEQNNLVLVDLDELKRLRSIEVEVGL